MAKNITVVRFDVQPVENEDGTLKALTIQRTERVRREADNGRTLDYGQTVDVGEPLVIPVSHLSGLVRELVDWPTYYARGDSAADRREPVSWPNSRENLLTEVDVVERSRNS